MRSFLTTVVLSSLLATPASAKIERVWLTHRSWTPDKIVVNWQTDQPGESIVRYGPTAQYAKTVQIDESVTLHHVELLLSGDAEVWHYSVQTAGERSPDATFKACPRDGTLRAAVVADWQGKPKLDAILKDDVHLLLTAGDNIASLHGPCGVGVKDCTKPYEQLIDAYPELFRSTPFMPVLGNHDREIRPRGDKPPAEPVYDVDATAYRRFFELPGEEWKWYFDVPAAGVRFVALDLNHIQDVGTTWQTCHAYDKTSEQFRWYEQLMTAKDQPPFVITLHNERSASIRNREGAAWHALFRRGTASITGFGYYAERAMVDGFPYYNTSLSGRGARYPDPKSTFMESEDSYILLTITPKPKRTLTIEIKSLAGKVLDRMEFPAAAGGPGTRATSN